LLLGSISLVLRSTSPLLSSTTRESHDKLPMSVCGRQGSFPAYPSLVARQRRSESAGRPTGPSRGLFQQQLIDIERISVVGGKKVRVTGQWGAPRTLTYADDKRGLVERRTRLILPRSKSAARIKRTTVFGRGKESHVLLSTPIEQRSGLEPPQFVFCVCASQRADRLYLASSRDASRRSRHPPQDMALFPSRPERCSIGVDRMMSSMMGMVAVPRGPAEVRGLSGRHFLRDTTGSRGIHLGRRRNLGAISSMRPFSSRVPDQAGMSYLDRPAAKEDG
jgi:hypothetical protein